MLLTAAPPHTIPGESPPHRQTDQKTDLWITLIDPRQRTFEMVERHTRFRGRQHARQTLLVQQDLWLLPYRRRRRRRVSPVPPVTQFQLPAQPRTVAQFIASPQSPAWPSLDRWRMVWNPLRCHNFLIGREFENFREGGFASAHGKCTHYVHVKCSNKPWSKHVVKERFIGKRPIKETVYKVLCEDLDLTFMHACGV